MSRLWHPSAGRCLLLVALLTAGAGATAPGSPGRPNAAAIVAELVDAMPDSFEIHSGDPCGGVWDVKLPSGETMMTIAVLRYRNIPMTHITGPGLAPMNELATRLDPRSIRTSNGADVVLRCSPNRAVAEVTIEPGVAPLLLNARPGKLGSPAKAFSTASGDEDAKASVREQYGNIEYVDAEGHGRQLTRDGGYGEPVLAPDGRTVAFIHIDSAGRDGASSATSLWLADGVTGTSRRLLSSRPDDDPKRNLASFQRPRFSLDGGYVYVDADAWATSPAVHQVEVATGAEHFVAAGSLLGVIRTGPYRGYLLVSQHKYHPAPAFGAYEQVIVIRPDGTEVMMVPESNEDDGTQSLPAWLKRNDWEAW